MPSTARKVGAVAMFLISTFLFWMFSTTFLLQIISTREVPKWIPLTTLAASSLLGWLAARSVWLGSAKKDAAKLP